MTASLTIDRWHLDCAVPRDAPDPERAVACVHNAVVRDLADRLAAQCERVLEPDDQTVVFVDSLECAADVGVHWDRDQWSQAIASTLARSLAARISSPGGPGIRIFADRAALVASYLVDAIDGLASQRWWYGAFSGLAPLPVSAVIRTLLASDHDVGVAALARLAHSARRRVLGAMNPLDAARVRAAWSARPTRNIELALRAAARALADAPVAGPLGFSDGLDLYVAAHAAENAVEGSLLFASIDTLAMLREGVSRGDGSAERLPDAIREIGPDALAAALPSTASMLLATLADAPREALAEAVTAVLATALRGNSPGVRFSAFGGTFLMLDAIDRLPLAGVLERLPPLDDTPAAQLVRLALLAHAAGATRSAEAFADPLLRDVLAIEPHITLAVFGHWLRGLAPRSVAALRRAVAVADRLTAGDRAWLDTTAPWPVSPAARILARGTAGLLRRVARRLPGFAASSFAHLHANFLTLAATAERSDAHMTVRLGRPPLDLVLGLSGLNRCELELAWTEPRRLLLYPAD